MVPLWFFFSSVALSYRWALLLGEKHALLPTSIYHRDDKAEVQRQRAQGTPSDSSLQNTRRREVMTNLVSFPYLKSDSSSVVEWLIMAQRQSMLELDRALPMHFFTM